MTVGYLDASAWVKRYFSEPGTDVVNSIFIELPIISSRLGYLETFAAIARQRSAWLTGGTWTDAVAELDEDLKSVVLIDISASVIQRSSDVCARYRLRAADAIHLATALILRDAVDTGDDQLVHCSRP